MAYVTVTDACFHGNHEEYSYPEPITPSLNGEFVCGGMICLCPCHGETDENNSFYLSVKEKARERLCSSTEE